MRLLTLQLAKFATLLTWQLMGTRRQVGDAVPVLCYHRVLPDLVEVEEPIYSVTPPQFDEQLALLAQHGFRSLSLSEYAEMARGRRPIPPRSVLITFDDGFADVYSYAWPIARRYGFTLNVFVCTGLICHRDPVIYRGLPARARRHQEDWPDLWRALTWKELRQMQAAGTEIGFHGHSHIQMAALSEEALRLELSTGLGLCESKLGRRPRFVALPNGTYESYNRKAISVLRESGAELVFTTRLGRTRLSKCGYLPSRIVVHQEDDLETFERKLYGAYDWLGHLRHFSQMPRALRRMPQFFKSEVGKEERYV